MLLLQIGLELFESSLTQCAAAPDYYSFRSFSSVVDIFVLARSVGRQTADVIDWQRTETSVTEYQS
jgi:hypothetical protein